MTESLTIQGRCLSPADPHALRQWVEENPHWSRWRLSRELATRWDWRNGAGVLKDMAGRSRQDRHNCLQVPRKEIYLYPLRRSFRAALGA
mgnify:CR=1 FL=1